jgi:hypothetical protein
VPTIHLAVDSPLDYLATKRVLYRMGARVFESGDHSTELSAMVGSLEVVKRVTIAIGSIESTRPAPGCVLPFRLRAAEGSAWYPAFEGALVIVPKPGAAITISLQGRYHPPGGVAGQIADSIAMHSLAEKALVGLLERVAEHLRQAVATADDLIGHPYS